ncbi:MAG: hypothetical protein Q8Q35_01790 [Nanoarchaeota archaeon]|nr:hypothetical protein [Nanoarchaeota archaeon]
MAFTWQTWTKITAVIIFLITIIGFVLDLTPESAELSIQNFPTSSDLDTLDIYEDIDFSFFLYNSGEKESFVKSIVINRYYEDGSQPTNTITISPEKDFKVSIQESKEINVKLPAPNEDESYQLELIIYYDDLTLQSEEVTAIWGTIS